MSIEPFSYRTLLSPDFNLEDWRIFHQTLPLLAQAVLVGVLPEAFPELSDATGYFAPAKQELLLRHGLIPVLASTSHMTNPSIPRTQYQQVRDTWGGHPSNAQLRANIHHWMTQHCLACLPVQQPVHSNSVHSSVLFETLRTQTDAARALLEAEMPEALERYRALYREAFRREEKRLAFYLPSFTGTFLK